MKTNLLRRWQLWIAISMIGIITGIAVFAPVISPPDDPSAPDTMKVIGSNRDPIPHPPDRIAPLGTTPHQYDIFHTLIWGTRQALIFGICVTLISTLFGAMIGAVCAYQGGLINRLFLRITDALLVFPLMAAIPFMYMFFDFLLMKIAPGDISAQASGNQASAMVQFLYTLFLQTGAFTLAVMLLAWIPYARLINDQILRLKNTEFITAAHSLGARRSRIILRHLIPNSLTPVIVWATKSVGALVILQATFTYIGLDEGSAWALILIQGKNWIIGPGGDLLGKWWVYLPVTLAIILFGFTWNLLGDEINTLMNPREITR